MVSITICLRPVASFEELVANLPPDAVASPRRSTVPLLDYWRDPQIRLDHLWQEIGYRPSGPTDLQFEYSVPVQKGRGKPSYTDLMIIADGIAVAVEAKFTEPLYERVRSWLGPSPTLNRADVLDGWLSLIGRVVGLPITREAVMDLPYQLVHRAASVCFVEQPHRYLMYQIFGDGSSPYYTEHLKSLVVTLGASDRIRFILLRCPFQGLEIYNQLEADWNSGSRDLGSQVRKALLSGCLLKFRNPTVLQIQP